MIDPGPVLTLPTPPTSTLVAQTEGVARLSNGATLWYWDTGGSGAAIVLAHPHSGNHRSWDYQQPVFAAAGYRVIGYSRRGYFQSDPGPAAVGSQGEDLALLLDALGVETCHVLGSAAGGTTALDFALAYPDRVLSAVVASSLMSIAEPDYRAQSARARGGWFEPLPIEAKELSPSFRALDPEGVARWRAIHDLNGFKPGERPVAQGTTARIDWASLGANVTPMLLMTGGADIFMPPALLRAVGARVRLSETVIVPDVGHPIFAEAPEAFNRVVLDFFRRNSGA